MVAFGEVGGPEYDAALCDMLGDCPDRQTTKPLDTPDLVVQTTISGDYNFNGAVDAADYTVWRNTLGHTGFGLAADSTGPSGMPDGTVSHLDYDEWKENFRLTLVPPEVAGDFNRNGTVDAADYTIWRNTLGKSGLGLLADGNANGEIDSGDYDIWKSHFGQTSGVGAAQATDSVAPVPEPCGLASLAIGFAAARCRFRSPSSRRARPS
jgi:hypothetical protein